MIAQGILRLGLPIAVCLWIGVMSAKADRSFAFSRDTFSFDNETALEFHDGHASPRPRTPGDSARREHLNRARQIFARLGAGHHLAQIDEALKTP